MHSNMEKELKHIEEQSLCNEYLKEIYQIINDDFNQAQLKKGTSLSISIDCFALGVIVGKRIDRAKRKISNAAVIKRQGELLLEIEVLSLKNMKLEKVLSDIKEVCFETSSVLSGKQPVGGSYDNTI